MHLSNGFRFLMSAKKRALNNSSNYLVTASKTDFNKIGRNYLGKVRSNFLGTEFSLFDSGESIQKSKNES